MVLILGGLLLINQIQIQQFVRVDLLLYVLVCNLCHRNFLLGYVELSVRQSISIVDKVLRFIL